MVSNPFSMWRRAERQAARFLKTRRFRIAEQNARIGRDEIDIVAVQGRVLVCVEVRFRARDLPTAIESIDGPKARALRRAARAYARREGLSQQHLRIDLVAVTRERGRWRIVHLPAIVPT